MNRCDCPEGLEELYGDKKYGDSRGRQTEIAAMNRTVKIEASLACANFKNLEADIEQLSAGGIDFSAWLTSWTGSLFLICLELWHHADGTRALQAFLRNAT